MLIKKLRIHKTEFFFNISLILAMNKMHNIILKIKHFKTIIIFLDYFFFLLIKLNAVIFEFNSRILNV